MALEESPKDIFDRGLRDGRVDAELDEHNRRLNKLNGSIERSAQAMEQMAGEIRGLRNDFATQIATAKAAAAALAAETEKRRTALVDSHSDSDRQFTRRERTLALIITALATIVGYYLKVHELG